VNLPPEVEEVGGIGSNLAQVVFYELVLNRVLTPTNEGGFKTTGKLRRRIAKNEYLGLGDKV
jgi:hypothetical protein